MNPKKIVITKSSESWKILFIDRNGNQKEVYGNLRKKFDIKGLLNDLEWAFKRVKKT